MKLHAIDNKLVLNAYDPEGNELKGQKQVIRNSPMGEYVPNVDAAIIQSHSWESDLTDKFVPLNDIIDTADKELMEDDEKAEYEARIAEYTAEVARLVDAGQIEGKTTDNGLEVQKTSFPTWRFAQPVNGYRRDFAWGSGVKTGKTIGLRTDIFANKGLLNFDEDTYRLGRSYFCNATGGVRGNLRVKMVPIGTVVPGAGPIDDGWGYVRSGVTDLVTPRYKKISAGKWQSSYSFLQRFELTDELFAELKPHIDAGIEEVNSDNESFVCLLNDKATSDDIQTRFAGLNKEMLQHPFVAHSLANTRAQRMFRVATAGNLTMDGGLFAPTTSDKLVLPSASRFTESDEYLITRYPIDGPGSIRAVETEQEGSEADRIAGMSAIQYTLTNWWRVSFKGMAGVVDEDNWPEPDFDMIVCVEDEKINAEGTVVKEPKAYDFKDAVLSITQWYDAGSCIGVPHDLAKDLNADYDGDQGAVVSGDKFPEMLKQTKTFKQLRNPKLPKTKTELTPGEGRTTAALLSMANLVGHATNVVSTVLGITDQERVAKQLKFEDADEMHEFFMLAIKLGTDIFKTSYDHRPVVAELGRITSRLSNAKIKAPWTNWKNDEAAFRHVIPPVTATYSNDWEKKHMILPEGECIGKQDAIIAELLRYILPKLDLPQEVVVRPLSSFRNYATSPASQEYHSVCQALLTRYAARIDEESFATHEEWDTFVSDWQTATRSVAKSRNLDWDLLMNALWYMSHNNQRISGLSATASAAFLADPDYAERIIVEGYMT